ncbi:hypothetical protein [Viridibacillus arvi]|uniref:hypothetical protein n=1 Tax=Viridibacillus arvi TaxID=263475 RepID=UPI00187B2679|nr:hypothetical protein [Viridibacillus sp. JNUCC-6]QOV12036.1 hypothetical protein JNUCC6_04490 [Viridibacillus sp. JNUCC-6]
MKPVLTVIKRNFASNLIALIITILVVLLSTTSSDASISISRGNYTYLYMLMMPFFIVYFNFSKLIHLNATKKDYFWGSILTYIIAAASISMVNTFIHLVIDPMNQTQIVINLLELCGWWENGVFVAFFQQFAFLLMVAVFLHVLLSMQSYWYGWLTNAVLVAIICVFVPIQPLRQILVSFFKLIMFNGNALLHISVCLSISMVLALVGLAVLKRRSI